MYPDLSPILDLDPEANFLVNAIVKKAPLDINVRLVARNIDQEFYWKE